MRAAAAAAWVALVVPAALAGQDAEEWWSGMDDGPGVHVAEVDSLYRISGFTHDDIYREMYRRGPGTDEIGVRLGLHTSQWRWSFRYREEPGRRCRVQDARVLLRSTIVLPEWTNVSTARREVGAGWREFVDALRHHEEGHRNRAKAQGVFLWQSLLGLEASTCAGLQRLVEATAGRVIEEGRQAQVEYDRDTGHGSTQGAVWPPRGPGRK